MSEIQLFIVIFTTFHLSLITSLIDNIFLQNILYLIHLIKQGKGTIQREDGTITKLSKGDFFINAPDEGSIVKSDINEPFEYYWIAFNGAYAKKIINEATNKRDGKYKGSAIIAIRELLDNSICDHIGTLNALFTVLNCIKSEALTNEDFVKENDNFPKGVLLSTYRKDDLICFFVNNELLFSTKESIVLANGETVTPKKQVILHGTETVDDYNEESILGIYSYSATAKFSQYSLLQDEEADNKFNTMFN